MGEKKNQNQALNEETFACSLTTPNGVNGILSFPYRGKPGWFIADTTQVCILQLLKCASATILTAELEFI